MRAFAVLLGVLATAGCKPGECAECQEEKCADLLSICRSDPGCECAADCMAREGVPGVPGCLSDCGLQERPVAFGAVEECVATACPDSDECDGENWTPPSDDGGGAGTTIPENLGDGELADCGFDDSLEFEPDGPVLQLQSGGGEVCVRMQRRNDGPGSLANTRWTLLDIRVGPLGAVSRVNDGGSMCWYSSHHNFRDWAHAWTGTRHFDVKLREDGHGGAREYELHTFAEGAVDAGTCGAAADGASPVGDPIILVPFP